MNIFKRKNDGSRGTITVLVTLFLVPTIVVNCFFVDLARLKLYGNQAVMSADNYGEAALSVYDNLLKDLYGLFAMAQSDEGIKALKELEEYMESSFDPNEKRIYWDHLANKGQAYEGFMPYSDAEFSVEHTYKATSSLTNNKILSTQIGDFMKFRIVQTFFDDSGTTVLDLAGNIGETQKNSEIFELKKKFEDKADEALTAAHDFYNLLVMGRKYQDEYIAGVYDTHNETINGFESIAASSEYRIYKDYIDNKAEIEAALDKRDAKENLSDSDIKYIQMHNSYQTTPNARKDQIKARFDHYIAAYEGVVDDEALDFDNYNEYALLVDKTCQRVVNAYNDLEAARIELREKLEDPNVSEDMRKGVESDLKLIDDLFTTGGTLSADSYVKIAEVICSQHNLDYSKESLDIVTDAVDRFEAIQSAYVECKDEIPEMPDNIDVDGYNVFYIFNRDSSNERLYNKLEEVFSLEGDESAAEQKQGEAENITDDMESKIAGSETSDARDIPDFTGIGMSSGDGGFEFRIADMLGSAVNLFSNNSLGEAFETLLLKLYMIQYDFGMFSHRLTNQDKKNADGSTESQEPAESLTGYELSRKINYLYMAELEYLFAGYRNSDDNLSSVRNKILTFRAVVNMSATYTVEEINSAINAIAGAAKVINPLLGIAVAAALRLAVTAAETYYDWTDLMEGKSVVLMKRELQDMTAVGELASLLGLEIAQNAEKSGIELNYEQYLLIMLLFLTPVDDITDRTGDLITLNINAVIQDIGNDGVLEEKSVGRLVGSNGMKNLDFVLSDAYTALDSTCTVKLGYAIIPPSMMQMLIGDDGVASVEDAFDNSYTFTVTRGY